MKQGSTISKGPAISLEGQVLIKAENKFLKFISILNFLWVGQLLSGVRKGHQVP